MSPRPYKEGPSWLGALNPFTGASQGWIGRVVDSFNPAAAPALSRRNYLRELGAACFLPFAIAAVEGGILGVIVKKYFAPLVESGDLSDSVLNFAVAVVSAAPAFANITSFLFVRLAHGRHKVRSVNTLQVGVAILATLVALRHARSWGFSRPSPAACSRGCAWRAS